MCSAQTAEPIEMLFVMWTQVAQETVCRLGQWGLQISPGEAAVLGESPFARCEVSVL